MVHRVNQDGESKVYLEKRHRYGKAHKAPGIENFELFVIFDANHVLYLYRIDNIIYSYQIDKENASKKWYKLKLFQLVNRLGLFTTPS